MATIITREVGATAKGTTLSNAEIDNNFINLNTDIATRIPSSEKGVVNGVATLDGAGKVPATQLPSYVDDVQEAANLAAFPATGETGKIYVALDTNKTYRWSGSAYIFITSGAVDSVAGKTGVVTLNNSDVGLGNVENKSSATIRGEITSDNVTGALGFTPYNATNPSGFITSSASITGNAATATRFLPVNVTASGLSNWNPQGFTYQAWGQSFTHSAISGDSGDLTMWLRPSEYLAGGTELSMIIDGDYYAGTGQHKVLHAGNYNSYALPLSGGTIAGTLFINSGTGAADYNDLWLGGAGGWATNESHGVNTYYGSLSSPSIFTRVDSLFDGTKAIMRWKNFYFGGAQTSTVMTLTATGTSTATLDVSGAITSQVGTFTNNGSSRVLYLKGSGNIIQFQDADGTDRWENVGRNGTYYIFKNYGTGSGTKFQINDSGDITINNGSTTNVSGALQQAGNQVLHAGNYSSYALPLSGGTLTGAIRTVTNTGIFIGSGVTTSDALRINFHTDGDLSYYIGKRAGTWTQPMDIAFYTGLRYHSHNAYGGHKFYTTGVDSNMSFSVGDGDNNVRVTNTLLIGGNTALHAGNYNSYSPTLTGGGASGTWGISVTGSAGSISTAGGYTLTGNSSEGVSSSWIGFPNGQGIWSTVNNAHLLPNNTGSYGSWYMYGSRNGWFGLHFGSGSTLMMNSTEVGFHREGYGWQMRWSAGVGYVHKGVGGGGTEATILDSSNYNSYSPTLTGGGASGTWGINVTGSAADSALLNGYGSSSSGGGNVILRTASNGYLYVNNWIHPANSTGLFYDAGVHFYELSNYMYSSTGFTAANDMRAPIFYDSNDTAYYLNPNSLSNLYDLQLTGGKHTYLYLNPGNGHEAMVRYNGGSGSGWFVGKRVTSQLVGTESFHFYSEAAGATVGGVDTSGNMFASGSHRAPIFYDNNNTAYYIDPNADSRLHGMLIVDGDHGDSTLRVRLNAGSNGAATGEVALQMWCSEPNVSWDWAGFGYNVRNDGAGNGFGRVNTSFGQAYMRMGTGGQWYFYTTDTGGTRTTNMYLAPGNGVETYGILRNDTDVRAPIYYDSNDTAYYLDPASSGVSLKIGGAIQGNHTSWTGEMNKIQWHSGYMYFQNTSDGAWIFRNSNGAEPHILYADGRGVATGSYRAPIFYDSNDTGYYLDPNSTSNFVGLTVANQISGSVSGTANGLSSSNYINRTGSSGNLNTDFSNTPAGTQRYQGDDASISNSPGGTWWIYEHKRHSNASSVWGTQVAWGWEDNANRLAQRNVSGSNWSGWVYYLNSANYNSYSPTLTGGGASGTWGISITGSSASTTGNAATATTLQTARTINGVGFNGSANITVADATKLPLSGGTVTGDLISTARLTSTPTTGWSLFFLGGQYNSFAWFHVGGESGSNDLRIGRVNRSNYAWEANPFTFDLTGGNFVATGNVSAYSDERLKKNWAAMPANFIEQLAGVRSGTYTRIDTNERQAGSSAQDWQKLLPEVVKVTSDKEGTLALAYGNAALVSAVELAKRVVEQDNRIAKLEALVAQLLAK